MIVHRGLTGGLVRLHKIAQSAACPVSSLFPSVSVRVGDARPINPDYHNNIILDALVHIATKKQEYSSGVDRIPYWFNCSVNQDLVHSDILTCT